MSTPIIVTVQGGVVQDIENITPGIEVEVHDYDVETTDPDDHLHPHEHDDDGEPFIRTVWKGGS